MLHLLSLAACVPQPWRNGGGTTRELLRWPAAPGDEPGPAGATNTAADDGWLVRVSVAEIARDGPFSPFPGVDRWFAVLEGAGVRLTLPEGEVARRPGDDALAFAGEVAPGCRLIDGTTSDLNLMVRRTGGLAGGGRGADGAVGSRDVGDVVATSAPSARAAAGADRAAYVGTSARPIASMRLAATGSVQRGRRPWRALYAHGPCRLLADDDWHDLPAGTLAWSDANRAETWELADAGLAFWMSFEPGSP